jgi:tetratricopeptide (TPR) repeat protein
VKLTEGEQARIGYGSTRNLEAWGYAVKARGFSNQLTKEGNVKARELLKKALEIDAEYAHALTSMAWTHFIDAWWEYSDTPEESFKRLVELAKKSLAMDDKDPHVHSLWQKIYLMQGEHDKAVEEGRKAIALGPNDAEAHMHFGQTLANSGFFEEAVQMSEKGMRLHPHRPLYYYVMTIESYYRAERYEECLAMAKQVIDPCRKSGYWGGVFACYIWSAMAHMKLGQESEAQKEVAEALKIFTSYSLEFERSMSLAKPAMLQEDLDVLRKAGVPEHPPSQ